MNILGWKIDEFELEGMPEKQWRYLFTIDGKLLEFDDFIPLEGCDIEEHDYLSDTQSVWKAPYLACCACGYVYCDVVKTFVKFDDDIVFWTVFSFNYVKPETLGAYCFDKEQYCQAINSLLEHIKANKTVEDI